MGFWQRLSKGARAFVDEIALPDHIRTQFDEAQKAFSDGELVLAEAQLIKLVETHPDFGKAWYLLGLVQLARKRASRAVDSLQRAATLKADDAEILAVLAEALWKAGDAKAALTKTGLAIRARPDEVLLAELYAQSGEIHLELKDIDRAIRELRKAVAVGRAKDLEVVALLGRAHYLVGNLSLARHALTQAATAATVKRETLCALADVLHTLAVFSESRMAALRLVEAHPKWPPAYICLARAELALADPTAAQQALLRAMEIDPRLPAPHVGLAEVYLALGDKKQALNHTLIAQSLTAEGSAEERVTLGRSIVQLQLELGAPVEMQTQAEALLGLCPGDSLALSALALFEAEEEEALALFGRALAQKETFATRLAMGLFYRRRNELEKAVLSFRAALRLGGDKKWVNEALAETYRALSSPKTAPDASIEFYPLLRRVQRLMLANAELAQYGPAVLRIQSDFDRPLLVAVMGEFNTGKSTFVNALIGEQVAPMGITPTTATINVLKYGEQQRARVLWRDDREEIIAWEDVGSFLRKLTDAQARSIRVVELLYPSEELQRVNVVDTPGLNSLVPEHEETAREYIEIADAVIWLFAADQAGKQTEEAALSTISKQRLKTVGVLNKVDRLNGEERKEVVQHIEAGFSHLIEGLMPVSSRQALKAIVDDDDAALQTSEFPELRRFLEARIFSRSRRIKLAAAERRLREVLAEADLGLQGQLDQLTHSVNTMANAQATLNRLGEAAVIKNERPRLQAELGETYLSAAREIVEFVRPRRWILGENEASVADKDYLVDLLQEGIAKYAAESESRLRSEFMALQGEVLVELREISSAASLPEFSGRVEEIGASFEHHLNLLRQVYRGYLSFVRGFLHGGWVDHFFGAVLPELEISIEPIRKALARRQLDVEGELLGPLAEWQAQGVTAQQEQLRALRQDLSLKRMDIELRLAEPLLALLTRLGTDELVAGN